MSALWPFAPLTPVGERLMFRSDVMRAYKAEQRYALRKAPVRMVMYTHRARPDEVRRAAALMRSNAGADWIVPLWHQAERVTGISAAATSVTVDAASADYIEGGKAVIWASSERWLLVDVASVGPDSISLDAAVGADYAQALVMPAAAGFTRVQPRAGSAISHGDFEFAAELRVNPYLGANPYDSYAGLSVPVGAPLVAPQPSIAVGPSRALLDSGVGYVATIGTQGYVEAIQTVRFRDVSRAAVHARRRWLHLLRGRQKPFWMPSWQPDLRAAASIGASSVNWQVVSIGAPEAYEGRHVAIILKSGTRLYRQIVAVTPGSGTDTLQLSAALGVAVAPADIRIAMFLGKMRLESDDIALDHHLAQYTDVTLSMREVPA